MPSQQWPRRAGRGGGQGALLLLLLPAAPLLLRCGGCVAPALTYSLVFCFFCLR